MRGRRAERGKGDEHRLPYRDELGGANVGFYICYVVVLHCVASPVKLRTTCWFIPIGRRTHFLKACTALDASLHKSFFLVTEMSLLARICSSFSTITILGVYCRFCSLKPTPQSS